MMDDCEALIIRAPGSLLNHASALKNDEESLNDLATESIDREAVRCQGFHTVREIIAIRAHAGDGSESAPDSTAVIRALREGMARRG